MKRDKDNNIINRDIAKGIQQVEADRDSINALQAISKSDLEQLLKNERVSNSSKLGIRKLVYASISIAAIATIVLTFNSLKNREGEILYQSYFVIPNNEGLITRGASNNISPKTFKFYDYYNDKEYEKGLQYALSTFGDTALAENPELLFYISICQLELNKNSDAENSLMQLSEYGDSFPFYQSVKWYLALTYLKQNKKEKAKELLSRIKEEGLFYSEKAIEILGKLK